MSAWLKNAKVVTVTWDECPLKETETGFCMDDPVVRSRTCNHPSRAYCACDWQECPLREGPLVIRIQEQSGDGIRVNAKPIVHPDVSIKEQPDD